MRTCEGAPLFRSSVRVDPATAWPPCDSETVADDQRRIARAVAGFTPDGIVRTQRDTVRLVPDRAAA